MRLIYASIIALAVAIVPAALVAQDADRKVAGGGIAVKGWQGKIDAGAAKKGLTINDSKFAGDTGNLHLTVGPAASYWNPANVVKGDYTVKATFREAKTDTSHPHPYGIFIGGSNLDTDKQTLLYCLAYSNGTYLVRGFSGGTVFNVGRGPHAAVNKAGADGSVTQEVGWTITGDRAECAINGQVVAGYTKSELVGPGKLESTDGVYGIRVSHNVDVTVTGLTAK
jgi:opacity protein-like surface antigen